MLLLSIATLLALPATYLVFDRIILSSFIYHKPIGPVELLGGVVMVTLSALAMIVFQTLKAARKNPSAVLKGD